MRLRLNLKRWLSNFIERLLRRKAIADERLRRQKLAEAVFITFSSAHGQVVLKHLLDEIFYSVSNPTGIQALDMSFNEGQRSTVWMLLDLMNEYQNPPDSVKVETEER
jgi:hypothetical protein